MWLPSQAVEFNVFLNSVTEHMEEWDLTVTHWNILNISGIAVKTKTVKNTVGEPEGKDTCENKTKKEPSSKEFSILLKIQERWGMCGSFSDLLLT